MSQEANVAFGAGETWMFLQDLGVLHVVEVRIHNYSSIQLDLNLTSVRCNLFFVPFSCLLQKAPLGRNHIVDRTVVLRRLERLVIGCVEDLNLHALVGCVTCQWRADAHSVVPGWFRAKLEAKHKVCEFLDGEEIAAAVFGTDQIAVPDHVPRSFLLDQRPSTKCFAVKQGNK